MRYLVRALVSVLITALFTPSARGDYNYPYTDRWVATVSAGLLRSSPDDAGITRQIVITRRNGTQGAPTPYRLYQQPNGGDLVIVIPGLGGEVTDAKPTFLADELFKAGHQVLIVPNDFTPEFAQGASLSGVVGVQTEDAADMRNMLLQILAYSKVTVTLRPTAVELAGYSLGALQAAFVSFQDAQATGQKLNLTRTVLINAPVDLWHGIEALDAIVGLGSRISLETKAELDIMALDILYKQWELPPSDPNYYLILKRFLPMPDVNFQYLVGKDFLSSLQEVDSSATTFAGYMQTVVMPSLATPTTVQALAESQSLTVMADFLRSNQSVVMMDNQDDILLQTSDLQFLTSTFGTRLKLYPYGGHLGNIWFPQNQADFLAAISE